MTASISTGAPSAVHSDSWSTLNWPKIKSGVFRLQVRIAKAEREGRTGKVKALQRILTNSFYAKCLAVKRVTSSTGAKTPGIDGVIWKTNIQKAQAVSGLKARGYSPQPLRRIYIPKKSGKLRPLSIPTLKDRAMQALWLTALCPVAEEWADPNAYGFRPKRSTHDATEQCFKALAKVKSGSWILEGDIKACFDRISHEWLLQNIPMDKIILRKFLKAGFMENGRFNPTHDGTPQGGLVSPTLAVMSLSGLEPLIVSPKERQRRKDKINMIAYADDFVVTAISKELIEEKVLPTLVSALRNVGLELSPEKTKITHIEKGFDFLGFNVRKYANGKLLIKPSKASITSFLEDIKDVIKKGGALPTDKLIHSLNAKITGWSNYYRNVVASKTFSQVDSEIFLALKRWAFKRHARKGKRWIISRYYTRHQGNRWRFHCMVKDKNGNKKPLYLKHASETKIRRHIKIRADATPFNPKFREYFEEREKDRKSRYSISNKTDSAGLRIIQPY